MSPNRPDPANPGTCVPRGCAAAAWGTSMSVGHVQTPASYHQLRKHQHGRDRAIHTAEMQSLGKARSCTIRV